MPALVEDNNAFSPGKVPLSFSIRASATISRIHFLLSFSGTIQSISRRILDHTMN